MRTAQKSPAVRRQRKAKLTHAEVALTLALVLVANQRPLNTGEIFEALAGAGYDIPALETMRVLSEGPFRCCSGKWVLAMASA